VEVQKGIEPVYTGDPNSPYFMESLSHYSLPLSTYHIPHTTYHSTYHIPLTTIVEWTVEWIVGCGDWGLVTGVVEKIEDLELWKTKVSKYCEGDCISLHQVLVKFRELIHAQFGILIDRYPTIPSLAFAIYRSSYMPSDTIPLTHGKVYNFIRQSFSGGSTDMFKPHGNNIYCYDVNSLYPSIMRNNDFPVGNIKKFVGDITLLNNRTNSTYWFGDVDVSTKKYLYQPYLQIPFNTGNGVRTLSPPQPTRNNCAVVSGKWFIFYDY
jgi:hypothetical protein